MRYANYNLATSVQYGITADSSAHCDLIFLQSFFLKNALCDLIFLQEMVSRRRVFSSLMFAFVKEACDSYGGRVSIVVVLGK